MENALWSAFWPEWEIVRHINGGAYGEVYEAIRTGDGIVDHAAIKVISVPKNDSELEALRATVISPVATRAYLEEIVGDVKNEIQIMVDLKGSPNIVNVEDYRIVEKTGTIGWDIFIRMELLTPLSAYLSDRTLSEEEVIKLGCDISFALERCSKYNVLHRDIKPDNILVNEFGDYKLGDFGIARTLDIVSNAFSQKGTYNYMAPEVAKRQAYNATADIYSLGIVLYWLLNKKRLPFLDVNKQLLTPREVAEASRRRLDGEPLPAPCEASPELAKVILRACEYEPAKRYSSSKEMKMALEEVRDGLKGDSMGIPEAGQVEDSGAGQAAGSGLAAGAGMATGSGVDLAAGAGLAAGSGLAAGAGRAAGSGLAAGAGRAAGSGLAAGAGRAAGSGLAAGRGGTQASGEAAGDNRNGDDESVSSGEQIKTFGEKKKPNTTNTRKLFYLTTIVFAVATLRFVIPRMFFSDKVDKTDSVIVAQGTEEGGAEEGGAEGGLAEGAGQSGAEGDLAEGDSTGVQSDGTGEGGAVENLAGGTGQSESGEYVVFADPALKYAVQRSMGIGDREITVSEAKEIFTLKLSGAEENPYGRIFDLTGLSAFKWLVTLDLSDNVISDISELSGLERLEYVHLEKNQISDLTPLQGKKYLKELDLFNNLIKDISPLADKVSLTMLDIRNNEIENIDALKELKELTELYIGMNMISDVSPIKGLTKITYLSMGFNKIEDISMLGDLKDLGVLVVKHNSITDISVVENFKHLYHLEVSENPITDYSVLDKLSDDVEIDVKKKNDE